MIRSNGGRVWVTMSNLLNDMLPVPKCCWLNSTGRCCTTTSAISVASSWQRWWQGGWEEEAPTTTVNTSGTGYTVGTLVANLESSSATITGGTITGITDLVVADGGTGVGSFTSKGILFGNGTGVLQVTAAGTQGQILQAGAGGTPEFGNVDGGSY